MLILHPGCLAVCLNDDREHLSLKHYMFQGIVTLMPWKGEKLGKGVG